MVLNKSQTVEAKRLALKYGFSLDQIKNMIDAQYRFIREKLMGLDLPKDLSEEDFNKVTKNFNIPSIGKLYSSYTVYKKINKIK